MSSFSAVVKKVMQGKKLSQTSNNTALARRFIRQGPHRCITTPNDGCPMADEQRVTSRYRRSVMLDDGMGFSLAGD
ncbi:hypothetical protein [Azomonas macrocytogenes]|uniref:Uncharacterized protein n=1 Tax=Azomonas macrocytogenes TaxID=69962 RepID=A0A839T655_AZOMA|nr:hypothetical protein [Azomonas macrocytogenes]MBB3103425.1 hypothetical protein [Azomonas macrocytogenes]